MPGKYQYDVEIKSNVTKLLTDMKEVQDRLDTVEGKEYKVKLNIDEKKLSSVISNLEKMLNSLSKGSNDFKQFENLSKQLTTITSDVKQLSNAFGKIDSSGTKTLLSYIQNIDNSLSSLSEHILNVNKNMSNIGGNTNNTVKQVENITNASKKATSALEDVVRTQAKLNNSKTNTSSGTKDAFQSGTTTASIEQQNKLQEEINETTNKFNNAKNSSKQELGDQDLQVLLSQQVSQYNQLIAKAEKYGDATSNVVQELKKERDIIASMNSDNIYVPKSGLTSDDYLRARDKYEINKAAFDSYETDIKKFEEEWAKLVEIDNAISNTQTLLNSLKVPSGFEGSFNNVKSTVESLNKDLENEQIILTEYNSQVKSAFNGFNNSVGEKQTQVWNELNNSLNRYATLQKRIASGNALSTDEKEASDLLNKIYELKRSDVLSTENIKNSSERLTQIRQTVEDIKKSAKENTLDSMQSVIDKYKKVFDQRSITPADFNQSDTYKKALGELSSSIKTLEEYKASLSGIDEITDEQKVHIEQLTMECEKCANAFKAMDSSEKGSNEASRYKEVDKLSKYLKENTRLSKEAKQQLEEYLNQLKSGDPNVNVKEIHTEWLKIAEAERMAGREGKSFLDILSTKSVHGFIGQMQSYLSMYIGFYGIINKIRSTISTVTELDTSLVDLKKTTTMNASELENFYFDSNKVAKQMGVTTKEIIEQASAWSRLGYNTKETSTEMAQLSSQFASISPGMDTDTAQEDLVSIMRAYDVSPSEVKSKIMDKINVLGKTIAQTYSNVWHTQMYVASW